MTDELKNYIKLSICIPTYNRPAFLRYAVDTIVPQLKAGVEVLISDNASSDDTPAVAEELSRRSPAIRYGRHEKNVGLDRNLLSLVEQARGEYCWFVSDDDGLQPGAVSAMLDALKDGCDVYLCGTAGYSKEMVYIGNDFPLDGDARTFELSDQRQMMDFLSSSRQAPFSFITMLCLKREKWLAIPDKTAMAGSVFNHVYCLFSMAQRGLRLRYLNKPLAIFRSGNCGFAKGGMVKRFLGDMEAYLQVADRCFSGKPDIQKLLISLVVRQHPVYKLAFLFYLAGPGEKARLETVVKRVYKKHVYYWSRLLSLLGPFWIVMYFIRQRVILKNDVEFMGLWRSARGVANRGWY